jgi:hypothetical protein
MCGSLTVSSFRLSTNAVPNLIPNLLTEVSANLRPKHLNAIRSTEPRGFGIAVLGNKKIEVAVITNQNFDVLA